jgi:hypothetical protein
LTDDGLYASGDNGGGQLGIPVDEIPIFTKVTGYEGEVLGGDNGSETVIFLTLVATYAMGFTYNLPKPGLETKGQRLDAVNSVRPTKLAIEMGYNKQTKTLIIDEEEREPETKKIRLKCEFCHGKARFMHSLKPVCSKYCVYKKI